MKKLVLIGLGIGIGYLLFSKKSVLQTVQLGEKGKEIEGMQRSIERLTGVRFENYGVYDKDTQAAVQYLMNGTSAMKNNEGDLDPEFVTDMAIMHKNSLNEIS